MPTVDYGAPLEGPITDDPQVDMALRIVAKRVAADLAEEVHDAWDGWPDLGLNHWEIIEDLVVKLVPQPDLDEYHAAYAFLASLAENEEA